MIVSESERAARALAQWVEKACARGRAALVVEATLREENPDVHEARIHDAKRLIAAGDLYQVNVARALDLTMGVGSGLELYAQLAKAAPTPWGAFLDLGNVELSSTSPELLMEFVPSAHGGGRILTMPIKGSRPRGADATEDDAHARELEASPKERAELAMILDVERNDLGTICETGTVTWTEPRVIRHQSILHREAIVSGQVRKGVSPEVIFQRILPSGSVTGAPKRRAMEVIAALEPRRRGYYTGGFGYVAHDGRVALAMTIRTAVTWMEGRTRIGEYWAGGGIVEGSDPRAEVEETYWKSLQLRRALQHCAS